ncbi:hypothetical protein BDB01DRAFT_844530 [Pilobolus umbonatus]|nr:hypothetical protein BDB01DRAFT_844530 [Pilobolus umbonatus]
MGNSIYTIFMPRESFSRRANAELVARSLHQLDIPAQVNERHDIVVDNHKVSGSAYKLTGKRAYHHGTMLIDTDIEMLKGCLSKKRMNNLGMVSKGVESVPSPVTNLRDYSYTIDHQQFCESVMAEFTGAYNDGIPVQPTLFDHINLPKKVEETRQSLMAWDWIYGQTPEFTNTIEKEFGWGHVKLTIHSKHGKIMRADILTNLSSEPIIFSGLAVALEGCQYNTMAIDDAIKKINIDVPGLINADNVHFTNDINQWIQHGL